MSLLCEFAASDVEKKEKKRKEEPKHVLKNVIVVAVRCHDACHDACDSARVLAPACVVVVEAKFSTKGCWWQGFFGTTRRVLCHPHPAHPDHHGWVCYAHLAK